MERSNKDIMAGFLTEEQKLDLVNLYMDVLQISPIIRSAYKDKIVLEHTYSDLGHYEVRIYNQLTDRDEEYTFFYQEFTQTAKEDIEWILWRDILKNKLDNIKDGETFKKVKTVICALVD